MKKGGRAAGPVEGRRRWRRDGMGARHGMAWGPLVGGEERYRDIAATACPRPPGSHPAPAMLNPQPMSARLETPRKTALGWVGVGVTCKQPKRRSEVLSHPFLSLPKAHAWNVAILGRSGAWRLSRHLGCGVK